jgi:hypothetical protein
LIVHKTKLKAREHNTVFRRAHQAVIKQISARDFAEKPYDDGASSYFIRSTTL